MQATKSQSNAAREKVQTGISFSASKEEFKTISKIARRAVQIAAEHGVEYSYMTADMDITACHANGCPLRLVALLNSDEFTFTHDVFGIRRHINRETGKLENCFVPRTAI